MASNRLRISLDAKYPGIIGECRQAITGVMPGNKVWQGARASALTRRPEKTCVEISAYSKRWPVLFPQHGQAESTSAESSSPGGSGLWSAPTQS